MNKKVETDYKALMVKALAEIRDLRTRLNDLEFAKTEPVAIIGIGCRFPGGADSPAAFWELLRNGGDGIVEVPKDRWDIDGYYDPDPEVPGRISCRDGGFLDNVDRFDSAFFGITPRELVSMDPQQRLLLEVAWEALENAGLSTATLFKSRTGVFTGISSFDYAVAQFMTTGPDKINAYLGTGIALSGAAGRLSYVLGLTGPSMAVDTACSSSLVAVHLACQSLRNRECTMALAGGVNVILAPELSINFSRAKMLAPDGRCKTFDAAADGYVRGEGCGVVVLKRLSEALVAGDRILALIRGSAVNQDGPSGGLTVPSGPSQVEVIRQALASGGVQAAEVGYVEAHGTGTSLGDPIEVGALGKVFGERSPADPLLVGSVKTNIGHLEAAAGISGLIKTVLALQEGEIPPHLNFRNPNPHIDWQKLPLEIPLQLRKWPTGKKKIAGVSSFGFTGTNAHIVLEEGPVIAVPENEMERPRHILALSAQSAAPLQELAGRFAGHLERHPGDGLADLCYTANCGRGHFAERLAVVGSTGTEIAAGLRAYAAEERPVAKAGKLAFIFPGIIQRADLPAIEQGLTLYETAPLFRKVLDRCGEFLRDRTDRPLLESLAAAGGLGQAALFALECGLFELWKSWGGAPSLVMGHGVGEYGAAYAAGVFSLEEGLNLAFARGMLPENTALAGAADLTAFAAVAGAINYRKPTVGFVSSLTGTVLTGPMLSRDYWLRQVTELPELEAGVNALAKEGAGIILELGPRSIPPRKDQGHPASLVTGGGDWQVLLGSLAELYELGLTIDWPGFDRDYQRRRISLPTYPFQRQRYWLADQSRDGAEEAGGKRPAARPPRGDTAPLAPAGAGEATGMKRKLLLAPGPERLRLLTRYILEVACKVMGHADAGLVKIDRPLMDQGLDSLMAVEMRNLLAEGLDLPLAVGLIFDYPSVADLCRHLAGRMDIVPVGDGVTSQGSTKPSDDEFAHLDELDSESLEDLIRKELL